MEPTDFAALLKRYRLAAGLTQEELAERAGLSARGVGNLERGARRTPYMDTVRRLADALALGDGARSRFEAAGGRMNPVQDDKGDDLPGHNLPAQLTSFVGRERELGELAEILGSHRLVTLTGVGGCGKTRLALQLATSRLLEYADGVRLAELGSISEAVLVPDAIASALGLEGRDGRASIEAMVDAVRTQELLLLLDNCEHLITTCASVAATLLSACPRLTILATSREPLRVAGELAWRVPSLSLPGAEELTTPDTALLTESVHLFCDRARRAAPSFDLTERNLQAVGQICRRLDGIPLAIELAATRVQALTPEQIASRLDDCFRLLTGGSRTALPQHQTLKAALDWSHALLSERERVLLQRLALFAGGFTLEAAEGVCSGGSIEGEDVITLLVSLVDQSLVVAEADQDGAMRYRLLEPVRQYARDHLEAAGEIDQVGEQHLTYYQALAERAAPELNGARQMLWLQRLEREQDNLRGALARTVERDDPIRGTRLAESLRRFWYTRGHLTEGRTWLMDLLAAMEAHPSEKPHDDVRARALVLAAELATDQADYQQAARLGEAGLALYRRLEDARGVGFALNVLGIAAAYQGDYARAKALCEDALILCRQQDDSWGIGVSLNNLGLVAREQGDCEWAVALYSESLELQHRLHDIWSIALLLNNLAEALADRGDLDEASVRYEESLAVRRQLGDVRGIADTLSALAFLEYRRRAHRRATALFQESLALYRQVGDRSRTAVCLEGIARTAFGQGEFERATRLFAAAAHLRQVIGHPVPATERAAYDQEVAGVRAALGEDRFALAWLAGWTAPSVESADELLTLVSGSLS